MKHLVFYLLIILALLSCSYLSYIEESSFKEHIYKVNSTYYVTYDAEGEWLLWNVEPHLEGTLWMPPDNTDFDCVSVSEDIVLFLIKNN